MKLDGKAKETSWLPESMDSRKNNLDAINKTVLELGTKKYKKIGNDYLWRNVDKNIVLNFLDNFQLFQNDPLGITARMPIGFVREYVLKRDVLWDVALYSGRGNTYIIVPGDVEIFMEQRKATNNNGHFEIKNRQVSSGNAESIALSKELREKLGSQRNEIRNNLKNPLLMLHILQIDQDEKLAAFGTSFPGNVLSQDETINLTINTVYYQNLLENEDYDD